MAIFVLHIFCVSTAGMFPYVPQTDDVVAFLEAVYVTPVWWRMAAVLHMCS